VVSHHPPVGTMIRYTFTMGLVVALAWAATTLDFEGRTLVEHGAERARALLQTAKSRAEAAARDAYQGARTRVVDAVGGWLESESGAAPSERGPSGRAPRSADRPGLVDGNATDAVPSRAAAARRARERVVQLDEARRRLKSTSSAPDRAESAASGRPDRPASDRERRALETRLGERD